MTAESISDVVEQAVEWTGMKNVPVEDRSRLVTDNGPGFLAQAFEDYLRMLALRHIRCSPHHPQTNGKLERFHETLKARVNLLVYTKSRGVASGRSRSSSSSTITGGITKGSEMLRRPMCTTGGGTAILQRREEQKRVTLEERFRYNRSRSKEINLGALSPKP